MLLSNLSIVEEPKGFSKSDTGNDNGEIEKGHFNVNCVFLSEFCSYNDKERKFAFEREREK